MGINIHINTILRQDINENLEVGKEYKFSKDGLHFFADNMPIWLTKKDWTVLADITIISQKRENGVTSGTYQINYLYEAGSEEQKALTEIFIRMYKPLFG